MARRNNHGITWQTIRLEGALLLPDLLEQIAKNEATHQKESEYQIPMGLRMVEEIGRSYQIARALHTDFEMRKRLSNQDTFQLTETFFTKFMSNCLGWNSFKKERSRRVGEYRFPIQRIAYEDIPLSIGPLDIPLDATDQRFAVGGKKDRNRSLFQMVQEYLNGVGKSSWGLISNGNVIRLLRSSPTLARPQYLEFDLHTILEDDHYAEYMLLWKILHVSRVYDSEYENVMTIWEEWRNETIATGERIRDGLRDGVTRALRILGSGFLANKLNSQLREKLEQGQLSEQELYHQLLHLVYRFLFLFALEERRSENGLRLIFDPNPELSEERDLYEKGYSLDRLRHVMLRRSSYNYYNDLWKTQQIVFESLARGEERLALPALGGLFSAGACDELDDGTLDNSAFLFAMESLRWARTTSGQYSYVDYRNMGTEELGSVYESLLELVPIVDLQANEFRFVGIEDDESTAGNVRKSTGSYYTPSFLVDQLIKTALVPVVERTIEENPDNAEEAILKLSIIDPACGSGHFLLAAARKTAEYLSLVRNPEGTFTPQEYRRAVKDVIHHCIYGVDLNSMALELTKIALWLEGYEPGKPLGFLDQHLVCGDSVLGVFDLGILDKGIPNDAFKSLSGDDEEICKQLRVENRTGLKSYGKLEDSPGQSDLFDEAPINEFFLSLEKMPEENVEDIEAKKKKYQELKALLNENKNLIAADILLGAFLLQKLPDKAIPTSQTLFRYNILRRPNPEDLRAIEEARKVCKELNVLHWPFAFPKIFSEGGFDVVLGNPPWDMLQFDPREFFAKSHPMIASAQNMAKRNKLINKLELNDPIKFKEYQKSNHYIQAKQSYVHCANRFENSGIGRVNLSSLFTETCLRLIKKNKKGRCGIIVPSGIATDSFTQQLFNSIINANSLVSLYDFENQGIFPSVHNSYKFCLLTLGYSQSANFSCYLSSLSELEDDRRQFELTSEDFKLINPNTRTLPIFRTKKDAELTKQIYRRVPVLINEAKGEEGNPWRIKFQLMFMMNTDSWLFEDTPTTNLYPLYEGKMLHQYDHRWATYDLNGETRDVTLEEKMDPSFEVTPRYWVPKREVFNRIANVPDSVRKAWYENEEHQLRDALASSNDKELQSLATTDSLMNKIDELMEKRSSNWLIGFRNISNATNERTFITYHFPLGGLGNSGTIIRVANPNDRLLLYCLLNSLTLDYVARVKVGGTNLNYFYVNQFPVPHPSQLSDKTKDYILQRAHCLTATSDAMAKTMNLNLYQWDTQERLVMRAELDAICARLYGLSREDLMYILDPESVMGEGYPSETFPGLKRKEIAEYGEYRTMRLVIEAWDRQEEEPELWQ